MKNLETNLNYSAYDIIAKKRDGKTLTDTEIKWFIAGVTNKSITDYQMSALLMAIYIKGFDKAETASLTDAMLFSGSTISFEGVDVIDKHSTGGVGDKASFILAPIAHAAGVKVPMMAGRGLGHTGGTIDKVESIKGFKTSLSLEEFKKAVDKNRMALIGQTGEIAPADKKIYALRDVTATVDSIPLITASIMSKKLAEGANGIVMDIKTGSGAFMKTRQKAKALGKSLRDTATRFDKKMLTMITDMNQPLGEAVGNSLEIIESIEVLKNKGPKDITDISVELAGAMIYLAEITKTHKAGIKKAKEVLKNGKALESFRELIRLQGGDHKVVDDYSRLPLAKNTKEVLATKSGYISSIACQEFGEHVVTLGGGRKKTEDLIDFGVGFIVHKCVGQKVKKGEKLVTIYYNNDQAEIVKNIEEEILTKNIKIKDAKPKVIKPLIYEIDENPLC
ncbi:pyrimidine-nucleoside phosphorylase [Halobacteriovorax marinus SJ]|uniref:thymidine phosphorylase n=1 Tax=Halobacteriovorax marinus (strain ATCC BAA-682 / DSM 15412 / SJ) TaxID=862908 RepID=E1WXH9_HALMS|nr:thymidine phosphorylase [Halobacteriovorax marinus]CBW27496.1 pyrimidine-nucleoside phosphorylase [Halobacteriovorax marinus SJ]